jgi:hypothetical protein
MKKKYIIWSIIACLGTGFQSCSEYLSVDRYFNDRQELERIFNSRDYTEQWLANAYYQLLSYNLEIGHTRFTLTNYSDDMIYTEGGSGISYSSFKFGQYGPQYTGNAGSLISGPWRQSYDGIRQASIFIDNVHPGDEIDEATCQDLKGQAYFVRGYLYWLLLRKYGPVPILPDEGLDYEAAYSALAYPRNTYDECVEYISEQMLQAAKLLENGRNTRSASRPTKGSALAVRAKAYLYAASPLMNGNAEMANFVNDQGEHLIAQQYDESKWARAAAAALDVIELEDFSIYVIPKRQTGGLLGAYPATVEPPYHPVYSENNWPDGWKDIDPMESYRSLFNGDLYVAENPELIFSRGDNQLNDEYGITSMSRHQMPVNQGGGWNCHGITGKQCDAYAMIDGTPFDRAATPKGFTTADGQYPYLRNNVWLEYANREPRFYASVAFSGANWPCTSASDAANRDFQVFYYYGESEGRKIISTNDRWIPTGIGMMKYVNPKESYKNGAVYPKVDPAIRYADVLLMYAEALNELGESPHQISSWDGSQTYTVARNIAEMKKAVLPVRLRAGLPNYDDVYPSDPYNSRDELRAALKHERQIEFLGENQRYYDLRRWKDAPVEEGAAIYGCNTTVPKDSRDHFYEQIVVASVQTAFSQKQYFWPIPWDELRRNARLTQAPGWPSYD